MKNILRNLKLECLIENLSSKFLVFTILLAMFYHVSPDIYYIGLYIFVEFVVRVGFDNMHIIYTKRLV